MIQIEQVVRQLIGNADAMRVLIERVSDEQAQWKPDPQTWSLKDVMEHVYNEERIDFRMHMMEILSDPPAAWGGLQREGYLSVTDCQQALQRFLPEREDSIAWLQALPATDWDASISTTFGPEDEVLTLSAGDVLVSWVAHDFLHIRQMNELLYAWNEQQAAPYSVRYAGGW